MNTDSNNNNNSHSGADCSCPAIGCQLPDYIVDLLNDEAAFRVEQHLVECHHCRDKYLTVLRVQGAALATGVISADSDGVPPVNESVNDIKVGNP